MPESEQEYPLHQHAANSRQQPFDDEEPGQTENRPPTRPLPPPRSLPREVYVSRLPRHGLRTAILAGIIAGVLCIIQSIIITMANASTYAAFEKATQAAVKNALAFTIFGIGLLTFFISMVIILVAGFIVGRAAVKRSYGFLAGFIAGILTYALSFLIQLIPNYPGTKGANGSITGTGPLVGGIFITIIFVLIWGIVGGLVSLLGAWLATRRHPYYTDHEE
ncbi:MAG TPA: YrzE family protein [Ktedonobacteraceae bacterium]|nr:YrzE family protein [Ktedonobacteraceae bacterium]